MTSATVTAPSSSSSVVVDELQAQRRRRRAGRQGHGAVARRRGEVVALLADGHRHGDLALPVGGEHGVAGHRHADGLGFVHHGGARRDRDPHLVVVAHRQAVPGDYHVALLLQHRGLRDAQAKASSQPLELGDELDVQVAQHGEELVVVRRHGEGRGGGSRREGDGVLAVGLQERLIGVVAAQQRAGNGQRLVQRPLAGQGEGDRAALVHGGGRGRQGQVGGLVVAHGDARRAASRVGHHAGALGGGAHLDDDRAVVLVHLVVVEVQAQPGRLLVFQRHGALPVLSGGQVVALLRHRDGDVQFDVPNTKGIDYRAGADREAGAPRLRHAVRRRGNPHLPHVVIGDEHQVQK